MSVNRERMLKVIKQVYWRDYVGREGKLDKLSDDEVSEIYNGIIAQSNYVAARRFGEEIRSKYAK